MNWTEKHELFCLEHDLPSSAVVLWQWLMRREDPDEISGKHLTDLRDFNEWVAGARGKPYTPQTIKNAITFLENAGAIKVSPLSHWALKRIVVLEVQ